MYLDLLQVWHILEEGHTSPPFFAGYAIGYYHRKFSILWCSLRDVFFLNCVQQKAEDNFAKASQQLEEFESGMEVVQKEKDKLSSQIEVMQEDKKVIWNPHVFIYVPSFFKQYFELFF